MRTAALSIVLGLTLIGGALVAEGTGLASSESALARAQFAEYDADGNNRISKEEARVSAGLATHFDKFDRDRDGTLSWKEFQRHSDPAEAQG